MRARILIYGAGVIGCLYAARLSEAGCSVFCIRSGKAACIPSGTGAPIAGFPGAVGGWDGDVLDAALTPRILQPLCHLALVVPLADAYFQT